MSSKQPSIRVGDRFQTSCGTKWTVMITKPFGVCTLTTEDFRMQSDFYTHQVREMVRLEGKNETIIRRMSAGL